MLSGSGMTVVMGMHVVFNVLLHLITCAAAEPMLPELPMNFLEHAKWDRLNMHNKHMADLAWWRTNLQGAPLAPLLATDYPRSSRVNLGNNVGDVVKVGHISMHIPMHTDLNNRLP